MPRSKQGIKRKPVVKNSVEAAAHLVINEQWSVRQAAHEFGISKSTLARHLQHHKSSERAEFHYVAKNDVRRVFSDQDEEQLKSYLVHASQMHYGLSRKNFRALAFDFAQVNNKPHPEKWDIEGMAGKNWYYEFMRRHKDALSLRKPQATSLARSTSFNRHNVGTFFGKLKDVLGRYNFPPESVYNIDETGLSTVHTPVNVIAAKGSKQVGHMTSGERGVNVTMIAAINAIGNSVPPAFVFPRVHFKENMLKGAPPASKGFAHISGWSNTEIFILYMKHFIEHVRPSQEKKILIVLDNHKSHISIECLNLAKESGIILLTFPPHTSHKLQPLDRGVFGPLKKYYNSACGEWMLQNCGKPMTIYEVAECAGKAYPLAFNPQNIMSGFRVCGIVPINENIFAEHEFLSCSVTDQPPPPPESSAFVPSNSSNQAFTDLQAQPSTSTISPQLIRPFPKVSLGKRRQGGPKPGRCRILTDTPEKNEIEEMLNASATVTRRSKAKVKRQVLKDDTSTSESDDSLPESSDSTNDVDDEVFEQPEDVEVKSEIKRDDFVLVKVPGKKKQHLYVAQILKADQSNFEVKYLKRCSHLSGNKFSYTNETPYEIVFDDILRKLPEPIPVGATARQGRCLIFPVNFESYHIE